MCEAGCMARVELQLDSSDVIIYIKEPDLEGGNTEDVVGGLY